MKHFILLTLFLLTIHTIYAQQSKCSISALGASLDTTLNAQTQLDEIELSAIFNVSGIGQANTISVGVGALSLTADGISTIFEVVKEGKEFYLVEQNMRFKVVNGTVNVFIHLDGKPGDYQNKYAIVKVTDKEGHTSEPQSVVIH